MTNTTRDIDYGAVSPPEDTDPAEYHYTHRRAELLEEVLEHGTPAAINQYDAAERYDVNQSTISRDLDVLAEYMAEHLGDRALLESEAVYSRAVEGLLEAAEDGDWRAYKAAADVIAKRNEWLGDVGAQHREPDRSEVDLEADVHSQAADEGYTVVEQAALDAADDDRATGENQSPEEEDLGFTATPDSLEAESEAEP